MDPTPVPASLDFLGLSVVTLTLVISLLSFAAALAALVWQFAKHFLDGGRVRVYLNMAIWEPEVMLATNRSGRFLLRDDQSAQAVVRGRALEVAQLVVENPGRIPVTVYSPGLAFSGHGKRSIRWRRGCSGRMGRTARMTHSRTTSCASSPTGG